MKILSFRLWVAGLILALGLFFIAPHPKIVQSQDPIQTIESDDPRVIQSGTWSTQTAAAASNGSYLFSSGTEDDVLALAFIGSAIEIIYVAGLQFGTLAIEVDGTVVRTVITTAEKIAYGLSAKVDYLSDEPHNVKVYAQAGGIIAVDAFRISPLSTVGEGLGGEVAPAALDDGGIQSSFCAPVNALHRVSLTEVGLQSPNRSISPSLSYNGRYVSFGSNAALVAGDGNGLYDIYLYDRQTCAVELISVNSVGVEGTSNSSDSAISANGRYVAFESDATNLVGGDSNAASDIFVRDRLTSTTIRVSVATGGGQSNGTADWPAISADGRYVGFRSSATNLVTGDTNGQNDVFVYDRSTGTTIRVSVATGGGQANSNSHEPTLSADGRYVAFQSNATNLVAGDTNGTSDIFVYDRNTGTTTRVSVATGNIQVNGFSDLPAISADGRFVAFTSFATNLVVGDTNGQTDMFVHDRNTGITTRVSVATGGIQAMGGMTGVGAAPSISDDGRYVAFDSSATNLVTGDTNGLNDIFVHDRSTGATSRASTNMGGVSPDGTSNGTSISGDGRYTAFYSDAADFVVGDTNALADVFVTSRSRFSTETLALFQPNFQIVGLIDTLADNPPLASFTFFSAYAPVAGGQWIMGDWDADGQQTPGVYLNGAFHYTNDLRETKTWQSLWVGINGPIVAGIVDNNNDCLGVIDSANFPPFGTAFVLYLVCEFSGNPTPPFFGQQWLSVLLPDSGGFSGTHQFFMGDWDGNGSNSIAVRRGAYIAWSNDDMFTSSATFPNAQYIGAPGTGSEGILVGNDWDNNGTDSFGLFYQNGELFYRNDLLFNSGAYTNQSVGTPFGTAGVQVSTWH